MRPRFESCTLYLVELSANFYSETQQVMGQLVIPGIPGWNPGLLASTIPRIGYYRDLGEWKDLICLLAFLMKMKQKF